MFHRYRYAFCHMADYVLHLLDIAITIRSYKARCSRLCITNESYTALYSIYSTCVACPYHSRDSPISSHVLASARRPSPSRANKSAVSFFGFTCDTHTDFLVALAAGCGLPGMDAPSAWTHEGPLAPVF